MLLNKQDYKNRYIKRSQEKIKIGRELNASYPDGRDNGLETKHAHGIRVSVPFNGAFSKNNLHRAAGGGMYWSGNTSVVRQELTYKIKGMRHKFFKGKVWIKIFVQRPTLAGDSINVVDVVADAIKDAIGIDDRWFAIESVDWQIVKNDPQIFVWVNQDITEPQELCSACGKITPLINFLPSVQRRAAEGIKQGQKFCDNCRAKKA